MPLCSVLASPVIDAALEQLHHPVREHLGVDPEVALVLEVEQHRVRDLADPHLQRRAVLDQVGHVLADRTRDVAHPGRLRQLDHRAVDLDHVRQARDVDEAVPERARHLPVHERHHGARALRRRLGALDAHAVGAEAVLVGRRDLDEGHVHRDHARAHQPRDLRQEHRHPVGAAVVDRGPHVRAGEERPVAEGTGRGGIDVRCFAEGHQVRDLDVAQLGGPRHQRAHQLFRVVAAGVQPDVVAGGDRAHRRFGRRHLVAVALAPDHRPAPAPGTQKGTSKVRASDSLAQRPRYR